ncbi:MAG: CBS domain-containing protein [Bacteroidales bacterium]|nr:CBS domain-containing protein [Bacteroidales bacterium]
MIAKELISDNIPFLKTTDTIEDALNIMETLKVAHLPIVNKLSLLGLISDTTLYDKQLTKSTIGELKQEYAMFFVKTDQNILDVISIMSQNNISVVPVLDEYDKYIGSIDSTSILKSFAAISSLDKPGAVIVLEINKYDYTLSKIAQIIESNDAKVLNMFVDSTKDSSMLEVCIKLNTNDLRSILRTFERYEYNVKSWISDDDSANKLYMERFNLLMKYLNT